MKFLKKLIVTSEQFDLIAKESKNIKITEIDIKNLNKDTLFKELNKNFIIKSKIENLSYFLLMYSEDNKLSKDDISELEDIIKGNRELAFDYANYIIKRRFPKGEDSIAKNSFNSLIYAEKIIKGPFPKGEDSISESPENSYNYAVNVIKGMWKKGHEVISQNPIIATKYAIFLNKRWKDIPGVNKRTAHFVETSIIKNHSTLPDYIKNFFNGQRWPEAEKYLLKNYINSTSIVSYAQKVIKGRWLEGEKVLLSMSINDDIELAYELYVYATNVIKGPWLEAERVIFEDPEVAIDYAANITKKRLPKEIEDEIANYRDVSIAINYAVDVYKKRWPEYEKNILKIKDEYQEMMNMMANAPEDQDYPDDIAFVHIEPIIDQYKKEVIKGPWPEAEIKI